MYEGKGQASNKHVCSKNSKECPILLLLCPNSGAGSFGEPSLFGQYGHEIEPLSFPKFSVRKVPPALSLINSFLADCSN